MKRFNTAGPCDERDHYLVEPEPRLPQFRPLLLDKHYFVLHAPRQSGKTTLLRTLAKKLTAEGTFTALYVSCEAAEVAQDDYEAAEKILLGYLSSQANLDLPDRLRPPPWPVAVPGERYKKALETWARSSPRPLILFLDEIDALRGESLRSVLRQLRSGFPERPHAFPHAVVLCGLRDVRDYKTASGGDPDRLGTSSPFNIKVKSLTLDNFTFAQTRDLYLQHTRATGQNWTKEAIARAYELTGGQPWLTNALAREIVEEKKHEGLI
jgi:type II secretory pathway predicted ATPase ExeA